ncbi:hypothetical protein LLG46_07965 [bacterium]|nr:hypothetical protein [bacterium]
MRAANPEWDFMSRTYTVLSLANMALRDPSYKRTACKVMDTIIDDTLRLERKHSFYYFMLPYGREGHWTVNPPRSIFVDGEIAMMLASRRMVEEKPAYKPLLQNRISNMTVQMSKSPVLSAESYPNECWLFCNTIALASIRMADVLDGTDHSEFLASWLRLAKAKLIDRKTGILISAFSVNGQPAECGFGAEGSSIWMACNMLQIVDDDFAHQQYRLAKKALSANVLRFGYAREWPRGNNGSLDIDSGPIAPLLNISPSSTGLAAIGAAAFDDDDYFRGIFASIEIGALPVKHDGQLRYCASNQVGDAVILYAMTEGPLWNAVLARLH